VDARPGALMVMAEGAPLDLNAHLGCQNRRVVGSGCSGARSQSVCRKVRPTSQMH
jgi:hypothetical protein